MRLLSSVVILGALAPAAAAPSESCVEAWQGAQADQTAKAARACVVACLRQPDIEVTGTWLPTCQRWMAERQATEAARAAEAKAKAVRDAIAARRPAYEGPRPGAETPQRPALHYVPIGTFMMGSPTKEPGRDEDEAQFAATLSAPFLMMRTEVTQQQWTAVMGTAPAYFAGCGADCPVERVNWFGAVTYANALSKAEGLTACYALSACTGTVGGACKPTEQGGRFCEGDYQCAVGHVAGCTGYRLPSEAQWEYAARADADGARHGVIDAVAWFDRNASGTTHPVGSKAANAWGLHDMLGNVWEWVEDWGGQYPSAPTADWRDLKAGVGRVVRGGSWRREAEAARAAHRSTDLPGRRLCDLGFRLVRAVGRAKGE